MSKWIDFFAVLDGWETATEFNKGILELSPDPAIVSARNTLTGQGNVDEALLLIIEQINRVRPAMRLFKFDLIQEVRADEAWNAKKLHYLASELHVLASLLYMRQANWEQARQHLLYAISCTPDNLRPRLGFVDFYLLIEEYEYAFYLLERLLFTDAQSPEASYQLYKSCMYIRDRGAIEPARNNFLRLCQLKVDNLFADLARLQIQNIDQDNAVIPSNDAIEKVRLRGVKQFEYGDLDSSLNSFLTVLSWYPDHGISWFAVGLICQNLANTAIRQHSVPKDSVKLITPVVIGSEQYHLLLKATQAFSLAIHFEPELNEAYIELANAYLMIDRPGLAIEPSIKAAELAPNRVETLSNLAQVFLINGELERASVVVDLALRIDQSDPVAVQVLMRLADLGVFNETRTE